MNKALPQRHDFSNFLLSQPIRPRQSSTLRPGSSDRLGNQSKQSLTTLFHGIQRKYLCKGIVRTLYLHFPSQELSIATRVCCRRILFLSERTNE
ncbi:hypothetical protein FGO68_gene1877 [Halteria grandinella]|uniref:Uncharacterized protein n=1 Tax=Halteria grandinella TaxID=5974 RepID=A0A8J8NEQ0_HALGN|nr:hypothetical protein FGO68_gene1877 [Halteria grandinella]